MQMRGEFKPSFRFPSSAPLVGPCPDTETGSLSGGAPRPPEEADDLISVGLHCNRDVSPAFLSLLFRTPRWSERFPLLRQFLGSHAYSAEKCQSVENEKGKSRRHAAPHQENDGLLSPSPAYKSSLKRAQHHIQQPGSSLSLSKH